MCVPAGSLGTGRPEMSTPELPGNPDLVLMEAISSNYSEALEVVPWG